MKEKCPSCSGIDEYESTPATCKKCGRYVKLILQEEREKIKRR